MLLENRIFPNLIFIAILVVQNIAIFWNHYFNKMGFLQDFSGVYFSIPAFWTTAVSQGIFPQWIPFHGMGFPFFLDAQTGFYYPFFWIFSLLSIPYTLDAAVIFQVLHVLFGSIGMFFFLKYLIKSSKYAIVGAVAFQFFGGFYSLSAYPDIIRAVAITPWLFYVITLNLERPALCRKVLFIPIVLYVFATGGYPGNYISSIFILSLFVGLQGINGFIRGKGMRKSVVIVVALLGLILLGIAISMIHLGPFLQFGDELTRFNETPWYWSILRPEGFSQIFIPVTDWVGPYLGTSYYLTLPILIFASFIPVSSIKKYWIFFVMLGVSVLMALGPGTFFYDSIISIFPVLGLSRFPVSDYRMFIVIPLLIFGIVGLKAILEKKFTLKKSVFRIAIILFWFSLGIISISYNLSNIETVISPPEKVDENQRIIVSSIVLAVTIGIILFYIIKSKKNDFGLLKKPTLFSLFVLILFSSVIVWDGSRTVNELVDWKITPLDYIYDKYNFQLEENGKLKTYGIFENLPDERPERILPKDKRTNFILQGHLDGNYYFHYEGGTALMSKQYILSTQSYQEFMTNKWTPLLLVEPFALHEKIFTYGTGFTGPSSHVTGDEGVTKLFLPRDIFSNSHVQSLSKQTSIVQTHYGINDITYQVSLDEPKLMVENEIYFPGWKAELIYPQHSVTIKALAVNNAFRAWNLPAGDYEMKANFEFPNLAVYQIISLSAFVIMITIIIIYWKKLALDSKVTQIKK